MSAELIVCDDDDRVFPVLRPLHGLNERLNLELAVLDVRVTRMVVVVTDRLDEDDIRQRAACDVAIEIRFVLQMIRLGLRAVGAPTRVKVKSLMMELVVRA